MSTDQVLVLRSFGPRLTKTHIRLPDGTTHTEPYGNARMYEGELVDVSDIFGLTTLLDALADDPRAAIVRGEPCRGVDLRKMTRKKSPPTEADPREADIRPTLTGRRWLKLDIDHLDMPQSAGVHIHDGEVVGIADPVMAVQSVIKTYLPDCFQGVTVRYSFSASAGVKPWSEVRMGLYFWMDRPLPDSLLKKWAAQLRTPSGKQVVDPLVFTANQLNYVATPKFEGMPDPCGDWRHGLIRGVRHEVSIPEPSTAPVAVDGEASGLRAYALAALHDEAAQLARMAPDSGRNSKLNDSGFSVAGFIAHGLLTADEIESALMDAAEACGLVEADGEAKCRDTLKRAIVAGEASPRSLPDAVDVGNDRPRISVNGRHLREISDEVLEVLSEADDLYLRAGLLVRVGPNGAERLTSAAFKGWLERRVNFVKQGLRDGVHSETPSRAPTDMIADVMSLPESDIPLRQLRAIARAPILTPDGRLIVEDGYDPATAILLQQDGLVGLRTDLDVTDAVAILDDLFHDFPFEEEAGRAHTFAMLIQPVVRHAFSGPTPLYLIDAPLRGTGKGLLNDVCAIVSTGQAAPVMPPLNDSAEVDKRITALLIEGTTHVLIDNVTQIRSTVLAALLTSEMWRGRVLGRTEMVQAPNHAVWTATGNNVEISDEIARRAMPIRLDARKERPEERRHFKHKNLKAWTRKNRVILLSAVLSLVHAWVDKGMPRGGATIGGFEGWAGVVGGILGVAGVPGFLRGREELHAHADRESAEWAAFLQAWEAERGLRPASASDLYDIASSNGVLLDLWAGRQRISAYQRIGHALKARRNRIYGSLRILASGPDPSTRSATYRLERIELEGVGSKPRKPPKPRKARPERHALGGVLNAEPRRTPAKIDKTTATGNRVQDGANDSLDGVSVVSGVFELPPIIEIDWAAFAEASDAGH